MPDTPLTPPDPPLVHAAVAAILTPAPVEGVCEPYSVADRWSILLTQRRSTTAYGGYWELPGGKIENDESAEEAAIREVREEIGCEVVALGVLEPIEHTYEHARVRLSCVRCELAAGSPAPKDIEVQAHAWRRLSDLPWDTFLPGNVRLVTALCRHLAG